MEYDEVTLKWLKDRSNVNVLRFCLNRLSGLPISAKYRLLDERYITRNPKNNRLVLTEKGQILLEESEEQ